MAPGQGDGARPPLVGKPAELQDALNARLFHPLARRLAVALSATPVTPNMISVSGVFVVTAAACAYTLVSWPLGVLIGFTLHMLWHVVDGADGDLARLTGRASPFGEMVDGMCDYAGHAILYVALAAFLDDSIGWYAWPLATLAAFSRAAQSNHAESQRRTYLWRAYGVPWLRQTKEADEGPFHRRGLGARLLAAVGTFYMAIADAVSPTSPALDKAAEQAATDPALRDRLHTLCKSLSGRALTLQSILGSNQRTLLLGASMALGTPLWFFLVELLAFNLLLLVSIGEQKRVNARVAAGLPTKNHSSPRT